MKKSLLLLLVVAPLAAEGPDITGLWEAQRIIVINTKIDNEEEAIYLQLLSPMASLVTLNYLGDFETVEFFETGQGKVNGKKNFLWLEAETWDQTIKGRTIFGENILDFTVTKIGDNTLVMFWDDASTWRSKYQPQFSAFVLTCKEEKD